MSFDKASADSISGLASLILEDMKKIKDCADKNHIAIHLSRTKEVIAKISETIDKALKEE